MMGCLKLLASDAKGNAGFEALRAQLCVRVCTSACRVEIFLYSIIIRAYKNLMQYFGKNQTKRNHS